MRPDSSNSTCFTLWYHAYGPSIGALRIYIADSNVTNRNLLWEISGQQSTDSNDWQQGILPIPVIQNDYVIILEGTVGKSYDGDISVDDIAFTNFTSSCSKKPSFSSPTTTTVGPSTSPPTVYG